MRVRYVIALDSREATSGPSTGASAGQRRICHKKANFNHGGQTYIAPFLQHLLRTYPSVQMLVRAREPRLCRIPGIQLPSPDLRCLVSAISRSHPRRSPMLRLPQRRGCLLTQQLEDRLPRLH
eukprot:6181192-Pleurochrysis_carterae.AAC.3